MSTWLITGTSTGLGRAIAEAAIKAGHNVVATARDVSTLADLASATPDRVEAVALDVTNPEQIADAVRRAEQRFGGVDVLVNNAGYGYRSAIEEGDDADVRRLFDTHFHGPIGLIKAVLPGQRARRSGAIVNISSIAATNHPIGAGYYAAAKASLEAASGALRGELAPLGISVTIVEPGSFRTDFAGRSLTQSAVPIADYAETAGRRRIEYDTDHGTQPGDPEQGAAVILGAVEHPNPPAFLLLGTEALELYKVTTDARAAEVAAWEAISASTDFAE